MARLSRGQRARGLFTSHSGDPGEGSEPPEASTCPAQAPITFQAFLSSTGWGQVVSRRGRESECPGRPVLDAEFGLWVPREQEDLKPSQALEVQKSQEILEKL